MGLRKTKMEFKNRINYTIIEAIKRKYPIKFNDQFCLYEFSPWVYGVLQHDSRDCVKGIITKRDNITYFDSRVFFIENLHNIRIICGNFIYPAGNLNLFWRRIYEKINHD